MSEKHLPGFWNTFFFLTVPDLLASQVVSFTLARTCTQASMHTLARRATSQIGSPFKGCAEEVGIDWPMNRRPEIDEFIVIVLPLPFQVDLHTHEPSSIFWFIRALHGSIPLTLFCTCSIISIGHGYKRGLSLDFHSLDNLTVGWRRMALCCF